MMRISWYDQAGCISFFVKSDNSDGDEICVGTSDGKHDHELLAPKVMNNMVMKTGPSGKGNFKVLGKLGPGQSGPGQLGPGQLGPRAQLSGAQLA